MPQNVRNYTFYLGNTQFWSMKYKYEKEMKSKDLFSNAIYSNEKKNMSKSIKNV